jgi:HEAT repeat protein
VRAAACAALGRLGAEEEVASLHDRLDDRLPAVRAAAATALGAVGDETSLHRLAVVAQRDDHVPAAAAAAALARIAPAALAEAARLPSAGPHLRAAQATADLRAAA